MILKLSYKSIGSAFHDDLIGFLR